MDGLNLRDSCPASRRYRNRFPGKAVLAVILLLIVPLTVWGNSGYPSPLLLSFDVEDPQDIAALDKLNIREPATYFITGQFASENPEVVKSLARKGTLGSHSQNHAHLTQMSTEDIAKDLAASQRAIQALSGQAPVWFRAPFLEYDDKILKVAQDLGFYFDSSESERWMQQSTLVEFPISMNTTGKVLFSDYDLFVSYGMDAELALDLLKENYLERKATGRPFVFLLHPRIIAEHAGTLQAFIDFVKKIGGNCLSFGQYYQQIVARRPARKGVRIDPRGLGADPAGTVDALKAAGITDVFLMARNPAGEKLYPDPGDDGAGRQAPFEKLHSSLKAAGMRVHAWISVNRNAALAKQVPPVAMVSKTGEFSTRWVSPSHPETLRDLRKTIRELLEIEDLAGIHLDQLGYPDLDFDYSDTAVQMFQEQTRIVVGGEDPADKLRQEHYAQWVAWRCGQISSLVKAARQTIQQSGRDDVVLSAALKPQAAVAYRAMEATGLDYRLLAGHLDLIIAMDSSARVLQGKSRPEGFFGTARFMVGVKPLWMGISFYDNFKAGISEDKLLANIQRAGVYGAHGLVFDVPGDFSGQGDRAATIQRTLLDILRRTDDIWRESPKPSIALPLAQAGSVRTSQEVRGDQPGPVWIWPVAGIAGVFTLVALLVFIGKRQKVKTRAALLTSKRSLPEGRQPGRDWRTLDEVIARGPINGELASDVTQLLRDHDPANVSQYRVALILDIIATAPGRLILSQLMEMKVRIPGWQVLSMSYVEEAVLLGYVVLKDGHAELSEKGRAELQRIKSKGYDRDYWMFVERRLHENLVASCPNCRTENVTHWFWPSFICSRCEQEVLLNHCEKIACRSPNVALDQHRIA